MGQAVIRAAEDQGVKVGSTIDVGDSLEEALAKCDTVIDFTTHHFSDALVAACVARGTRMVIGTTGHTNEELARIRAARWLADKPAGLYDMQDVLGLK